MNRKNLAIIGFVALIAIALYVFSNQKSPPPSGSGAPLVAVTLPTLSTAEVQGKLKYDQSCASCHGENAAGQDGVAPPLVHRIYEPNHHGDRAFFQAALSGVRAHHWPFGDMPPVAGITQDDVAEIINYVRALQRANGIK